MSTMAPRSANHDAILQQLKQDLKITPKTASTLMKAGYTTPSQIADASPDTIARQFGEILKVPASHVTSYRRAFRRICWVAAQDNPGKYAEECKDWSNKALMVRGLWCGGFDELTGREIDAKVKEVEGSRGNKMVQQANEIVKRSKGTAKKATRHGRSRKAATVAA